jgi:hypothetical protein
MVKLKGEVLAHYERCAWAVANLPGVRLVLPAGIMPYVNPYRNPAHPSRYCSDRCFTGAQSGESSYAPCPLLPDRSYEPRELCEQCGWIIPLDRMNKEY